MSHGRPAFFTKKVFAYYGGSLKVDGEWVQHPHSIVVVPDSAGARRCSRTSVYPPTSGPSGWIGVDLEDISGWTGWSNYWIRPKSSPFKRSIATLDSLD